MSVAAGSNFAVSMPAAATPVEEEMLLRRGLHVSPVVILLGITSVCNVAPSTAQEPWSLPAPWTGQDVGDPAIAGSASFEENQFTVSAGGKDIWESSDEFHFIHQQISGDVDVMARVDSIATAHIWSKAGVMIRASLAPGAAHGFALVSAARGVAFQRRAEESGLSTHTAGPVAVAPWWVRLVRAGSRVTAYSSADGSTWSVIGSSTIALGSTAYVGLAATSHNAAAATTTGMSRVSVVPLSLPAWQQAADIGAPDLAGSVTFREGVYTHRAGGTDIWNSADEFNFVYQQVSGDVEVVARVASIRYSHRWSKSGVMLRQDLSSGSRHAFAVASAGAGFAFQRRVDAGGVSLHTAGPLATPPGWVRLVRTGSRIEAFASPDGRTWTSMGVDAIPMADAVYVGIATTSHNASATTDAVVESLRITPAEPAANVPPQIAITEPTDGTTVTAGTTINVAAAANDSDGTVTRVDFLAGSAAIGSDTTPPYATTWSPAAGTYSLTASAIDSDGASATSATVSVRVDPAVNEPPAVTMTAPADGTAYAAPATVVLSAAAADPENALARVEFHSSGLLLGTDTAPPYSFTWAGVPAGTYTFHAVAFDGEGASAASSQVTVTIAAPTPAPPAGVAFLASSNHTEAVSSYELRIFLSGADPNTASPVVTSDLGKPATDANGDISVDRTAFFNNLAPGSYVAAVMAIGPGGASTSAGVAFTR